MNIFSVAHFVLVHVPFVLLSVFGLVFHTWVSQFYISCIEVIIMAILIDVLTIIEFKTGKILDYEPLPVFEDEFAGMSSR